MRPIIEKLTPEENTSFVARTYRTPMFEVPWHQHMEYELILFKEGHGTSYIGNHVGSFVVGDIYLLGSNLPHTFQKSHTELVTSALVIQFTDHFWGNDFLLLPECVLLRKLLSASARGLKLNPTLSASIGLALQSIEEKQGVERITLLLHCLNAIAVSGEYLAVSSLEVGQFNSRNQHRIEGTIQFTIDRFRELITLEEVAGQAGLTVPAFCAFFKRSTKKTYIEFLNEVRIGYACRQLQGSSKTVQEICYDSGFNTFSNFHKQFTRVKHVTPSEYRKKFALQAGV